jgi:hypothetical protein
MGCSAKTEDRNRTNKHAIRPIHKSNRTLGPFTAPGTAADTCLRLSLPTHDKPIEIKYLQEILHAFGIKEMHHLKFPAPFYVQLLYHF